MIDAQTVALGHAPRSIGFDEPSTRLGKSRVPSVCVAEIGTQPLPARVELSPTSIEIQAAHIRPVHALEGPKLHISLKNRSA